MTSRPSAAQPTLLLGSVRLYEPACKNHLMLLLLLERPKCPRADGSLLAVASTESRTVDLTSGTRRRLSINNKGTFNTGSNIMCREVQEEAFLKNPDNK